MICEQKKTHCITGKINEVLERNKLFLFSIIKIIY